MHRYTSRSRGLCLALIEAWSRRRWVQWRLCMCWEDYCGLVRRVTCLINSLTTSEGYRKHTDECSVFYAPPPFLIWTHVCIAYSDVLCTIHFPVLIHLQIFQNKHVMHLIIEYQFFKNGDTVVNSSIFAGVLLTWF